METQQFTPTLMKSITFVVSYKLPVLEHQEVRIPVSLIFLSSQLFLKVHIKGHSYKIHVHYIQSLL